MRCVGAFRAGGRISLLILILEAWVHVASQAAGKGQEEPFQLDVIAAGQAHDVNTFDYGQNWNQYLKNVINKPPLSGIGMDLRVRAMMQHLKESFFQQDFTGKTFIDVGSGSGIVSLAAVLLQAERVISFDYLESSVETTGMLRKRYLAGEVEGVLVLENSAERWTVQQGSILDAEFLQGLPQADLVYSYGVIVTTGEPWLALQNIARLVSPQGVLFFATHVVECDRADKSLRPWLAFKEQFVRMPHWQKDFYLVAYAMSELGESLKPCFEKSEYHTRNTNFERFTLMSECMQIHFQHYVLGSRGMDFLTDARDWLGGYPYAFLPTDRIIRFLSHEVAPAMKLLHVDSNAMAGFRWARASARDLYFTSSPVGHWGGYDLVDLDKGSFYAWPQYQERCERQRERERDRSHDAACNAFAKLSQSVTGERCFVYAYDFGAFAKTQRLALNTDEDILGWQCAQTDVKLLENMDILGWSGEDKDELFCAEGSGARYRAFKSEGLLVFSTVHNTDPRLNHHTYHLLFPKPSRLSGLMSCESRGTA